MKGLRLVLPVAVVAALFGCEESSPLLEAVGYVTTCAEISFTPRELCVRFVEGLSEAEMEAAITATGSTVLSHGLGSTSYLAETPLGYSLQEIMDDLSADPRVSSCSPSWFYVCGPIAYVLMAEDGSGSLWPLTDGSGQLVEDVLLEYVVRVRGHEYGIDGIPCLHVTSVEILRDRVIERHGTITLVDRGSEGLVVILAEGSGDAWELLGGVADEIAALPDVEGADITVDGCERPVSLTSRAGGLELRVTSYLYGARELVAVALDHIDYDSGSRITFLTTELEPGARIELGEVLGGGVYVVEKSGYLVFIDEQPLYDWVHAMQLVFVHRIAPDQPDVIFASNGAPDFAVKDPSGDPVTGDWKEF